MDEPMDWAALFRDIFCVVVFAVGLDWISTRVGWRISWQSTMAVCTLIMLAFVVQWGRIRRIALGDSINHLTEEIEELRQSIRDDRRR